MKPFLKWVGGKRQLLPQLLPLLPGDMEHRRYTEPFLGGGALFFELLPKSTRLGDINRRLINTYRMLKLGRFKLLLDTLEGLQELHKVDCEGTFYAARDAFNCAEGTLIDQEIQAARFIYLNRTCFNGVYRENRKGAFNVPRGTYKNPTICDRETLLACRQALEHVAISCCDFSDWSYYALDFVYLDPPYIPVSETANFTSYSKSGFDQGNQIRLLQLCHRLDEEIGCKFMLSNSDTPVTRKLYKDFDITEVSATRAVNSNASKRGPIGELVIRNYTR